MRIPKQENLESVKPLRPISLCDTIYKIVTKVIVNIIKLLITNWVSQNQNGFIEERCTEINLVSAYDILHSMHKIIKEDALVGFESGSRKGL